MAYYRAARIGGQWMVVTPEGRLGPYDTEQKAKDHAELLEERWNRQQKDRKTKG